MGMIVHALTEKGDKIIIQPPVYHPFKQIVEGTGRVVVNNPLLFVGGGYRIDFAQLREVINGCKLLILCHPHNPGGVVWEQKDLEMLAEICTENNVVVLSDEMHADLTLSPARHLPFSMVNDMAKRISVTVMSPAKAFNIAGLAASHAVVFDDFLRKKLFHYIRYNGLDLGNVFGYLAVEAAYTYGEAWLEQLLDYLKENIDFVDSWFRNRMPKIKSVRPQASFLVFLDCREMGFATQEELDAFFVEGAGLALNSGTMFGQEGKGFMRMNIAVPKAVLEKAMSRLEEAYSSHTSFI
jgi:cystathionine beta-lyase